MADLESVRQFFLKDARLLERHLFHYHFEGGSREAVLRALLAYQTESGGFAYGLEPDKRSAHPQPIDQEQALRVLADIGPDEAVLARILDFLPTITTAEGGVPFVLETVSDAPRAPWWNTEPDPPAALNPTASIVGLFYGLGVTHPWLDAATDFVWEKLENLHEAEVHTLLSVLMFLENVPERERAESTLERLAAEIFRHTALETGAEGYVHPPYAFAPQPESLATRLYDKSLMQRHLEALTKKQQADGGWTISWPAVSPGSELEYRGIVTLNALKTLRAYGMLWWKGNLMPDAFKEALLELFGEAYTGPNHAYTWFIDNKPGSGLFGTLAPLSAEAASEEGPSGTTIAAHTEHLRWSLAHANAFARGEVPTGGWAESWSVRTVDAEAWDTLRAALRREYDTLLAAIDRQEDFSDPQLLRGMLALVPHAAYHLGAIRQLVP